jgi:hypothetical protein
LKRTSFANTRSQFDPESPSRPSLVEPAGELATAAFCSVGPKSSLRSMRVALESDSGLLYEIAQRCPGASGDQ